MRGPAAEDLARRVAAAALILLGLGPLAWSMLWRTMQGAPLAPALLDPWAAAAAYIAAPDAPPALAASGLGAAALSALLLALALRPAPPLPFGDARFATRRELARQGLASPTGVLLGRRAGLVPAYLRHGGDRHVLLVAPTRSGKGVGVVTPNLLSWPGSVVVLDVKNENFAATSGFRGACGQRVFRFAPADPDLATHRYNPLDAVRRDPRHRIADLQAVAHLLTPEGVGEQRMWNQEARALFVGLSLYILDTPGLALTFGEVARILQADADLGEALLGVAKARGSALDPVCCNIFANFAHKAYKERSGVKSTLTGCLELFNDPAIDAATAASDFGFADLRREPSTVYVSVALDQLERIAFLLNIMFQQLVGLVSHAPPGADEPWPLLILIDEFAALGRMDLVVDRMPFLAGFNVKLLLVVQGLAQLDRLYGAAARELILQNAGLQLFFAPNDDVTSHYVSARLGARTISVETRSRSRPRWDAGAGQVTRSRSLASRPLMTPDEVRRLPADRAILFVESGRPVAARKIVYHADRAFSARVSLPVEVPRIEVEVRPPYRFAGALAPARPTECEPAAAPASPAAGTARRPRPARRSRPDDAFAQLDFDRLIAGSVP